MLTTIPFSGFYNSMWDNELEELYAEYDCTGTSPYNIDWTKVHTTLARNYTRHFADDLGVKLDFVELRSPREYNFVTDRIYANLSIEDLYRLLEQSTYDNHLTLGAIIKKRCTSCSGFISFYSNKLSTWLDKPLQDWDHNEVGILVEAVANIREVSEEKIFENMSVNGNIHTAFWEGTPRGKGTEVLR